MLTVMSISVAIATLKMGLAIGMFAFLRMTPELYAFGHEPLWDGRYHEEVPITLPRYVYCGVGKFLTPWLSRREWSLEQ